MAMNQSDKIDELTHTVPNAERIADAMLAKCEATQRGPVPAGRDVELIALPSGGRATREEIDSWARALSNVHNVLGRFDSAFRDDDAIDGCDAVDALGEIFDLLNKGVRS